MHSGTNFRFYTFATKILALVALSLTFAGCGDVNSKIKAQTTAGIDATNDDQAKKAKAMEADLDVQQRFYQGVSGVYEGAFALEDKIPTEIKAKLVISPSIPPYRSARVRDLAEIIADVSNLHLNIEVVQWDAETGATFGCIFTNIRPDLASGVIKLIASDCPNTYQLGLLDASAGPSDQTGPNASSNMAKKILTQEANSSDKLVVDLIPTKTPNAFRFLVNRTQ